MKYYIRKDETNTIRSLGTKKFNSQNSEIEVPIEFKSEGICKNNWKEVKYYMKNNLDFKINF